MGEESRVLFVGLTRARESVYKGSGLTERERTRQLVSDPLDNKSTRRWYSVRDRELNRVEITSEDARSDEPYVGELRASETQEYILKSVNAGDKIHLQKTKIYDRRGFPSYEIVHNRAIVGEMRPQFIADLALILRKEEMIQFGFPTVMNNKEGIETNINIEPHRNLLALPMDDGKIVNQPALENKISR